MQRKTLIAVGLGLGVAALLFFSKGKASAASGGGSAPSGKPPAKINKGETVSASTYKIITKRRAGYRYVTAKKKGALIEFTSPVAGYFMRNVLQEGGRWSAEIKG